MPERRVPDVVAQRDRLGQRLVERERRSQRARDLRDLQRVGQARDEVVALGVEEDLRLVLEAAERLGMEDAIPVAFEGRAKRVRLLRPRAAPTCRRARRRRREALLLGLADRSITADQVRHGPMMTDASPSGAGRWSGSVRADGGGRFLQGWS